MKRLIDDPRGESGFSLIEILVVILIIGVLAAIAIPSFIGQKSKATDAQAKELARTAQTTLETYATDNNGSYAGATLAKLEEVEPSLKTNAAKEAAISEVKASASTYKIVATSTSNDTFAIERVSGGETKRTCSQAVGGHGCPNGSW